MKKTAKSLLTLLLMAALALGLLACGANKTGNDAAKSGLWENATYLTDTELGQGSKNLIVEVKAGDQSVKFTVHTDETTVGDALLTNGLIVGDEGDYGLYIKEVNGIVADYDVDQSYWAFYVDGEYATAGVDSTEIAEESVYKLEYTK